MFYVWKRVKLCTLSVHWILIKSAIGLIEFPLATSKKYLSHHPWRVISFEFARSIALAEDAWQMLEQRGTLGWGRGRGRLLLRPLILRWTLTVQPSVKKHISSGNFGNVQLPPPPRLFVCVAHKLITPALGGCTGSPDVPVAAATGKDTPGWLGFSQLVTCSSQLLNRAFPLCRLTTAVKCTRGY